MHHLDGGNVTPEQLLGIALRHEHALLTTQSVDRIAVSRAFADDVATRRPIYGRTTGVGANRTVPVHDPDGQLERLLRSHSTNLGVPRSRSRVRAMVAVRVAQLAADGNGISVGAVQALLDGLNSDGLPQVREGGGIGTGDLAPLATIGVWLLDRPEDRALEPGDGLTLMSSNAAAIGDALLALDAFERLGDVAVLAGSLVLRAISGNLEAFSPAVEAASPYPGVAEVAAQVRRLSESSWGTWDPARIQDPFALRCLPQVHGAATDAIARLRQVITLAVNAPSENPMLSAQHGVAHHGGFHALHLAQATESVLSAVASAAASSVARTSLLADPTYTGLQPFLSDGTPGASGTMTAEYAAASRLALLRAAAMPSSVHAISLSRGLEDDASFAATSARTALDATEAYTEILAVELFTAARCLHQQGHALPAVLGPLVADLADASDRDLTPALDRAVELVRAWPA